MISTEEIEKDLYAIINYEDKIKWEYFGAKSKSSYLNKINIKYPNRPKGTHLKVYLELLLGKYASKEDRTKQKEKEYFVKYYLEHRESKLKYQKEYRDNNSEEIAEYKKEYRLLNNDRLKEIDKEYKKNNRGIINAQCAKRRASKLLRTPIWANIELIKEFYTKCSEGYHVDHIIPLMGDNVSGLHTIENLQYLTAADNMSKGNKYII